MNMKTVSALCKLGSLKMRFALVVLAALTVGGVALWVLRTPVSPVSAVTIAVPTQINSALAIVATSQGLFQTAGVNVISKPARVKVVVASVMQPTAEYHCQPNAT
ncbi:MAG: hypothetical protein Q8J70_05015 [Thiobacillus sp.]|nr:hypothetical protein [Thiobacillus sp.]